MKKCNLSILAILLCSIVQINAQLIDSWDGYYPEEEVLPSNNSGTGPSNTITTLKHILKNFRNNNNNSNPNPSGDFGFENLTLSGGVSYTSFDDANVGSSGHFRDYNLTISADITEKDTVYLGLSQTRYETGSINGILARTQGLSLTWVHNLTENYGIGAFGFANDVDIEEINGNSYSYGYGLLFTTFHALKHFNLSSATTVAHTDFDTGYDQVIMAALTISKPWTDKFTTYATLSFNDSFKSNPETDPTYGSWEVGVNYLFTQQLMMNLAFARTEFLNNYSDNSIILNFSWFF